MIEGVLQRLRRLPQLLQFVLVGGSAAATHLAVVGLLVSLLSLPPLGANVLAFLVAFGVEGFNAELMPPFLVELGMPLHLVVFSVLVAIKGRAWM